MLLLVVLHGYAHEAELDWEKTEISEAYAAERGLQARVHETTHYRILHIGANDAPKWLGPRLELANRQFEERFSRHGFSLDAPEGTLNWVCFDRREDFEFYSYNTDLVRLPHLDGYYSEWSNRVALVGASARRSAAQAADKEAAFASNLHEHDPQMSTAMRIATHEAIHQLAYNRKLLSRGVNYPIWVTEGMATALENLPAPDADLATANPLRRQRLIQAHEDRNLLPLQEFLTLSRSPEDARQARIVYAQAWAVYVMLMQEKPDQLRRYLAHLHEADFGPRGSRLIAAEITDFFGDVAALEVTWKAFIAQLAAQ